MECERPREDEIQRRRRLREKRPERRHNSLTRTQDTSKNQDIPITQKKREAGRFSALFHEGIEEIVAQLQRGELDFNTTISFGLFPLHEAAACGLLDSAKALIDLGAELTLETPDGLTPLEVAVMAGNFDAAALLIQNGAPVDRIRDGMPIVVR